MIGFRSPLFTFKLFLKCIACWAWISGVLGIAAQYFNSETPFVKYWTVAAMPFYILSQPVIIAIGFYIVQWPLSILTKFCLITATSFITTILIYEGIKRNNALRWLFGIPLKNSVQKVKQHLPGKTFLKSLHISKKKSIDLNV